MDPNDPHSTEWYALVMAGIATVAAGIWKAVFGFRKDLRNDFGGQAQMDTDVAAKNAQRSLFAELQSEVSRLSAMVSELSVRLDEEISKRREVERENHDLRLRIIVLENRLEGVQG